MVKTAPRLEGLSVNGNLAVVYSRDDIGCAWTSGPGIVCGVKEGDAFSLTLNVLVHGLTR